MLPFLGYVFVKTQGVVDDAVVVVVVEGKNLIYDDNLLKNK